MTGSRGAKSTIASRTRREQVNAAQGVLVALRRIMRAVDLRSRQLVRQSGVSGPQLIVLQQLARTGAGVPVGALARAVHLSHATVTGIVSRLERRGLVVRRDDRADRRRVLVRATPAGRRLLATAPLPIQESFVTAFDRLAKGEQAQILSSLERVVAMMEASDLDAAPILATGPLTAMPSRPPRRSA